MKRENWHWHKNKIFKTCQHLIVSQQLLIFQASTRKDLWKFLALCILSPKFLLIVSHAETHHCKASGDKQLCNSHCDVDEIQEQCSLSGEPVCIHNQAKISAQPMSEGGSVQKYQDYACYIQYRAFMKLKNLA